MGGAIAGGGTQGAINGAGSGANNEVYNKQHDNDDEAQLTGDSESSNPFSRPWWVLVMQGISNGLNALMPGEAGEPPVGPSMAPAGSGAGQAVNVTSGTPGYVPSNVTLNSGGNDGGDSASSPPSGNTTNTTPQTPFQRGLQIQGDALSALGVPENTQRITVELPDGTPVVVVPDALDGSTIVEVKDVANLSNSNQFRGYLATGNPVELIVSPNTQTISQPLQNLVTSSGGSIRVFNSATGTFSPWTAK